MSNSSKSPQEEPSTYFVQNRNNKDEMNRLSIQDQMLTTAMGGVLPEQADPMRFRHILDIGCGTGGWLIETAKAYPTITQLVGVDISGKMITYAQVQAEAQQVEQRTQFRTMDVLRTLPFPDHSFDLINERLAGSFLRTWDWPNLLTELLRVIRPDGTVRLTEAGIIQQSSSPALTQLNSLFLEAMDRSGHLFTANENGVIGELPNLLQRFGFQQVQSRTHLIRFRARTPEWKSFYENDKYAFQTFLPFLRQWILVPDDYEEIYRQALREMQQADFVATWKYVTVWGVAPTLK